MRDYHLVIFDLDGTLLDTTEGILSSIDYTIQKLNLPSLSEEDKLSFIGPPVPDSLAKYYGLSGEALKEATAIFRNNYSEQNLLLAKPYTGIYDVLEYLHKKEIKLAVATYKREDYALKLLQHYGFSKYMDVMFGADNENKLKKEDIILKCINTIGVQDMARIVMIGDTMYDAVGAELLSLDFIAVTYGFGFKKGVDYPEIKPVAFVDAPLQLINIFH